MNPDEIYKYQEYVSMLKHDDIYNELILIYDIPITSKNLSRKLYLNTEFPIQFFQWFLYQIQLFMNLEDKLFRDDRTRSSSFGSINSLSKEPQSILQVQSKQDKQDITKIQPTPVSKIDKIKKVRTIINPSPTTINNSTPSTSSINKPQKFSIDVSKSKSFNRLFNDTESSSKSTTTIGFSRAVENNSNPLQDIENEVKSSLSRPPLTPNLIRQVSADGNTTHNNDSLDEVTILSIDRMSKLFSCFLRNNHLPILTCMSLIRKLLSLTALSNDAKLAIQSKGLPTILTSSNSLNIFLKRIVQESLPFIKGFGNVLIERLINHNIIKRDKTLFQQILELKENIDIIEEYGISSILDQLLIKVNENFRKDLLNLEGLRHENKSKLDKDLYQQREKFYDEFYNAIERFYSQEYNFPKIFYSNPSKSDSLQSLLKNIKNLNNKNSQWFATLFSQMFDFHIDSQLQNYFQAKVSLNKTNQFSQPTFNNASQQNFNPNSPYFYYASFISNEFGGPLVLFYYLILEFNSPIFLPFIEQLILVTWERITSLFHFQTISSNPTSASSNSQSFLWSSPSNSQASSIPNENSIELFVMHLFQILSYAKLLSCLYLKQSRLQSKELTYQNISQALLNGLNKSIQSNELSLYIYFLVKCMKTFYNLESLTYSPNQGEFQFSQAPNNCLALSSSFSPILSLLCSIHLSESFQPKTTYLTSNKLFILMEIQDLLYFFPYGSFQLSTQPLIINEPPINSLDYQNFSFTSLFFELIYPELISSYSFLPNELKEIPSLSKIQNNYQADEKERYSRNSTNNSNIQQSLSSHSASFHDLTTVSTPQKKASSNAIKPILTKSPSNQQTSLKSPFPTKKSDREHSKNESLARSLFGSKDLSLTNSLLILKLKNEFWSRFPRLANIDILVSNIFHILCTDFIKQHINHACLLLKEKTQYLFQSHPINISDENKIENSSYQSQLTEKKLLFQKIFDTIWKEFDSISINEINKFCDQILLQVTSLYMLFVSGSRDVINLAIFLTNFKLQSLRDKNINFVKNHFLQEYKKASLILIEKLELYEKERNDQFNLLKSSIQEPIIIKKNSTLNFPLVELSIQDSGYIHNVYDSKKIDEFIQNFNDVINDLISEKIIQLNYHDNIHSIIWNILSNDPSETGENIAYFLNSYSLLIELSHSFLLSTQNNSECTQSKIKDSLLLNSFYFESKISSPNSSLLFDIIEKIRLLFLSFLSHINNKIYKYQEQSSLLSHTFESFDQESLGKLRIGFSKWVINSLPFLLAIDHMLLCQYHKEFSLNQNPMTDSIESIYLWANNQNGEILLSDILIQLFENNWISKISFSQIITMMLRDRISYYYQHCKTIPSLSNFIRYSIYLLMNRIVKSKFPTIKVDNTKSVNSIFSLIKDSNPLPILEYLGQELYDVLVN